eukprot:6932711-Alexandrium_andersonii.AAC.1
MCIRDRRLPCGHRRLLQRLGALPDLALGVGPALRVIQQAHDAKAVDLGFRQRQGLRALAARRAIRPRR